jgi:asparagine synthase (glutamine-hydrolysing)
LSQHNLYDKFKKDCRVIFDGSGGDEIGAGYSYYLAPWYLDNIKIFNKEKIKKRFYRNVNFIKNETLSVSQFIKGSFAQFKRPGSSTIDGSMYQNNSIYSKEFLKFNDELIIKKPFKSHLRNAQYADLFHLKLPRSLKYADRSSMYNSIETRVPFLDHKVVEWSLQIPSKFKLLQNQQRIIMKYPFKNYVNNEVLYLNKRTIADPQSSWLKTHLKPMFYDTVNSKDFNNHGFFDKKNIINYFEKFLKSSEHFNSFLIFQILISELWSQNILLKNKI